MTPQQKFHLTSIVSICLVIVVIYSIMKPSAPETSSAASTNGRAVDIYSATWGENCNRYIEQEINVRANAPLPKDEKGNLIEQPKLELVQTNNALAAVKKLCDGQIACSVPTTADALGEPLKTCRKEIDVNYRCFAVDRLWNAHSLQGKALTIDCNENKSPAQANQASSPAAQ